MKSIAATLTAVLLAAAAAPAFANSAPTDSQDNGAKSPAIHHRFENQKDRIRQGEKSGELGRGETGDLKHDERAIHEQKRDDKSDGHFTKAERGKIRHEQRAESREIYRDKHNDRERPRADRWNYRRHRAC